MAVYTTLLAHIIFQFIHTIIHSIILNKRTLPGANSRMELGPALQQEDSLPTAGASELQSNLLNNAEPLWTTPLFTELRRTLLRFAALRSTLLSFAATTHPTGLCRTLLSYMHRTPTELRHTLLIYAAPYWVTPHPTELRHTLLIYTAPYWATPHPNDLCHTHRSYAAPEPKTWFKDVFVNYQRSDTRWT